MLCTKAPDLKRLVYKIYFCRAREIKFAYKYTEDTLSLRALELTAVYAECEQRYLYLKRRNILFILNFKCQNGIK